MSTGTLYNTGHRFTHLDASGTTTIRSTATRLVRINVNTVDTGASVAVYNAATAAGEQVANIAAAANAGAGTYELDVVLSGGLTVVLTADPDITVVYQ